MLLLESFDALSEPDSPSGPSSEWLDGFAAGQAKGLITGRSQAEAEAAHLSAETARHLQDLAFGYAEARGQVLASLRPLFELVIHRLLPAMAAEALTPWLVQALVDAARADSTAPMSIGLHPDRIGAVRACLPPSLPALIRPDPTLGPNAARLSSRSGESDLDLDACLAALREALSALLDETAGRLRYG